MNNQQNNSSSSLILSIIIPLLLLAAGVACILHFKKPLQEWYARLTTPPAPAAPEPPKEPEPPAPQPPKEPEPTPKPEPTPPPAPEKPKPKPLPRPTERAHSAEHATMLHVAVALQPEAGEAGEAALEKMIEQGNLSPENAKKLRDWAREHPGFKVEEVGLADDQPASGQKETRYRLTAPQPPQAPQAEGAAPAAEQAPAARHDLIISVTTPKQGRPSITRVEEAPADKTMVTAQSDALSVVEGFVEALKRGDMGAARRLTGSGADISDATLAGLCIMFEEGDFSLRKKLPIRSMFKTEGNAGYIIHMAPHNETGQSGSVGIELNYDAEKGWAVKAVAMDDLLNRYEASGEAEGGVYFPLVKNPQGGDSLVLYFGFNDATPSPRSLSQLRIVANLLKGSQGVLNISGHTDDIGTVQYNLELSERRAQAVKEALIAHGVRADQISTKGLGKSQPRRTYRPGDNMETIRTIRSGNRRAEIYLDF